MQKRSATVAVIGAGDYIGGEIAKKFASEGFTIFAGRRNGANHHICTAHADMTFWLLSKSIQSQKNQARLS